MATRFGTHYTRRPHPIRSLRRWARKVRLRLFVQARSKFLDVEGDSMQGEIDMNDNKIINCGSPEDEEDVTNKKYVDRVDTSLRSYVDNLSLVKHRKSVLYRSGAIVNHQINPSQDYDIIILTLRFNQRYTMATIPKYNMYRDIEINCISPKEVKAFCGTILLLNTTKEELRFQVKNFCEFNLNDRSRIYYNHNALYAVVEIVLI